MSVSRKQDEKRYVIPGQKHLTGHQQVEKVTNLSIKTDSIVIS